LSTPSKPKDSPTYEVVVNVFHNGTPEEYIKAIIAIDKVCKGQGIEKEAKQKYVMAHRILQGHALTSLITLPMMYGQMKIKMVCHWIKEKNLLRISIL
jgi:hypothetical protein